LAISTGAVSQEDWDQRVDAAKHEAIEEATQITDKQISDLEGQLQAQQLKLQDSDLERKILQTDLGTSQRDLSTSQSNAQQLQHNLQRERNGNQTLATSRDALQIRVTDFEAREKNQRKEIQLLQAKRKTEQGESEAKTTSLEEQLHLARSSLQSEKDRCENRKAELNAAEAELRKTLEKSKAENQRLTNENATLRRSMSSTNALTAEKGKAIREKEQAVEEKNQAARDKHGAIAEKDAVIRENVALQARVKDLEAETAQQHEKITTLCSLHQSSLREKVAGIAALEKNYEILAV
jgi:chromosome segregation ATPase